MGRNAAQAQQQNIIPLQHTKGRVPVAGERPRCANPQCDNFVILTATGRISKYCANPQCPKTAWYYSKISKEVRAKNAEATAEEKQRRVFAEGYAQALADQSQAVNHPDPAPMVAAFERIAAALESGALTQMRLPLSDIGQSNDDDAPLPLTPLKPAKGGSSRGKKTTPPANPNNIDLEIKKTTKPGNAGRALILQVWLTSSEKNIELFKDEDLEMVTGHPAFNQDLIKKEIKRRAKLVKADASVSPSPQAEKGQGGEVAPGEIRKIAGADRPMAEPDYDDLEDLL